MRKVAWQLIALLFLSLCSDFGVAQIFKPAEEMPPPHSEANSPDNWNSISLQGSYLVAKEPLLGLKNEEADFTQEMLEVQWRDGDPIHLFVIKPTGVIKPPVILYLFSYPSETDRYLDDDFCRLLTRNGFAAVGFVPALTGQRYHDRPMKEWFISELQESLATSTHDVQMILNYLASRGDLDMSRVGMFGDGAGASIAILASAADPRIKALDLLDPWGDWPKWLAMSTLIPENERANYLTPEFLQRVAGLDPVKWLPKVQAQAVRLQTVANVSVTPKEVKEKMAAALPAGGVTVYYADGVVFVKQAGFGGKVFDWIKAQLGANESAQQRPATGSQQSAAQSTRQPE
jgi:hypothetical protein